MSKRDDIETEFIEILAQVRTHLEFQKALGVAHVETVSPGALTDASAAPVARPERGGEAAPVSPPAARRQQASVVIGKTPSASRPEPPKTQDLEAVRAGMSGCAACKLGGERKAVVFGEGSPRADILFVGGAPGAEEEKQARPFADAAGQLLTNIIVKGMELRREDVYITTAVKCRTAEGSSPAPDELEACAKFLSFQIDAIKPKIIIALGNAAAQALLNIKKDIADLRGTWHEYRGIPVMPTFEPAQLLANPGDKKAVWEDIKKVIAALRKTKTKDIPR